MNDNNKFVIDGVKYPNDDEALKAVNEVNGINYVKSKTDLKDPALVLSIYNKMLDRKLFRTINGYSYLLSLQEYLKNCDSINKNDIRPIEAPAYVEDEDKVKHRIESSYKSKFFNTLIVAGLLVIVIIAMIFITTNSKNLNILNYKDRLDAMYEDKENELAVWDKQLRDKEAELDQKDSTKNTDEAETTTAH